uniref:Large envelope protein n=2 Tax=Parrot hepatitis B virus TaxID=1128118 RepID=M1G4W7_9HEPA|nr:large S protein [Parrot hepatitis B virus]
MKQASCISVILSILLHLKESPILGRRNTLSSNDNNMGQSPAKSMATHRVEGGELLIHQLSQPLLKPTPPQTLSGRFPSIEHVMEHVQAAEELNTLLKQGLYPEGTGRVLGVPNPKPPTSQRVTWTPEEDKQALETYAKYQAEREAALKEFEKKLAPVKPQQQQEKPPIVPAWKVTEKEIPFVESSTWSPQEVPVIKVPKVPKKKMSTTFGGILLGLIGLLVGFFLLIKILETLRKLDSWWTSLSSPKDKMLCGFQSIGAQTSPHYVGSCPWGCTGFLWTCLRLFIIFLLILLVVAGLLYLTENLSTILGKLQWASVSALFSSISSLLPSDQKSLVVLIFGLLLIWMTSSSVTQTLVTLTQLATLSALFYKNSG